MRARYGSSVVALMVSCGFLVGVIVAVVLGTSDSSGGTSTQRASSTPPALRTSPAKPVPAPKPVPATPRVPSVVGERLDAAKDALADYDVKVEGGGLFGVVVDANWVVVSQSPPAGSTLEAGRAVTVEVERG